MKNKSMSVELRLYDLSNGLARNLSLSLLGKYIDGIWHSGIVVFGVEYFFGGGICKQDPNSFSSGTPTKTLSLGTTSLTKQSFEDFLDSISYKYTLESYHLLHHNCNHFTDECSMFLLGTHTPSEVRNLSEEVISTPFGSMIQPLINSFIQQKNQNIKPVVDPYQHYLQHEDVFPEFFQVTDEAQIKEFTDGDGVLVFWDPSDDAFLVTWVDKLGRLSGKVGCVDCLRHPYLRRGECPMIQVLLQGEVVISEGSPEAIDHAIAILAS